MSPTQRSLKMLREQGWHCEIVEQLAHLIEPNEDGCWIWIGAIDKSTGYGRCSKKKAGIGEQWAHRFVYRICIGEINDGLQIDHLCRIRSCVNPDHLEVVSHSENSKRSPIIGRAHALKTKCVHGHDRTTQNLYVSKYGTRACKICRTENVKRWRAKKKL